MYPFNLKRRIDITHLTNAEVNSLLSQSYRGRKIRKVKANEWELEEPTLFKINQHKANSNHLEIKSIDQNKYLELTVSNSTGLVVAVFFTAIIIGASISMYEEKRSYYEPLLLIIPIWVIIPCIVYVGYWFLLPAFKDLERSIASKKNQEAH